MPAGSSYKIYADTTSGGPMTLVTNGSSWASPVTFKRISGAASDTFRVNPQFFYAHVVTLNYTRFEDMGFDEFLERDAVFRNCSPRL